MRDSKKYICDEKQFDVVEKKFNLKIYYNKKVSS